MENFVWGEGPVDMEHIGCWLCGTGLCSNPVTCYTLGGKSCNLLKDGKLLEKWYVVTGKWSLKFSVTKKKCHFFSKKEGEQNLCYNKTLFAPPGSPYSSAAWVENNSY